MLHKTSLARGVSRESAIPERLSVFCRSSNFVPHALPLTRLVGPSLTCCTRLPPASRLPVQRRAQQDSQTGQQDSTSNQAADASNPSKADDPFVAASQRLQGMLLACGDGEDEMVNTLVAEESPESRLQMQCLLGGVLTVATVAICALCGHDPWGGASWSSDSLFAAGVGGAMAAPLVWLRVWSWSPAAATELEDMHVLMLQLQAPWFTNSAAWHVVAMMALEVLPVMLLLLPAAQGGLQAAADMYYTTFQGGADDLYMHTNVAMAASGSLRLVCLAITASVVAISKGLEVSVSEQEYEVAQTAANNSDRFYRMTAMSTEARSDTAERAALAFRSVVQAWMDQRNGASLAASMVAFLDVSALGGIWYASGNLVAPAVAALAINSVDYFYLHKAVQAKEARIKTASIARNGSR